jgi:hypothetical protein
MPQVKWELLHPRMTEAHLGFISGWLFDNDPRSTKEQIDYHYVSGWSHFDGFKLNDDNSLSYPGDPPQMPLAQAKLRNELIVFYPSAWVAVIQPDRSFEVARID